MPPAFALSQDQTLRFIMPDPGERTPKVPAKRTNPVSQYKARQSLVWSTRNQPHKRNCNASKSRYITATPKSTQYQSNQSSYAKLQNHQNQGPDCLPRSHAEKHGGADNVSLPSNMQLSKNAGKPGPRQTWVRRGRRLVGAVPRCVNAITHFS